MLTVQETLQEVLAAVHPLGSEKISLPASPGRTVAVDIVAREHSPPFDTCARNGFALCARDTLIASVDHPVCFRVIGEATAGTPFGERVGAHETVRVATGAVLPEGADAVVSSREVRGSGDESVLAAGPVNSGTGIRITGEEIAAGSVLLSAGSPVRPEHLHLFASAGIMKIRVHEQPHVNILASGDELVDADETPGLGQIRSSVSYSLAALAGAAGATADLRGNVPDKRKRIRKSLRENADCDALIITGGVSAGPRDMVRDALEESGADIRVSGVRMKPGRPFLFALYRRIPVFALPGNPLSALVAFLQFARPALWKMSGRSCLAPPRTTAVLEAPVSGGSDRSRFLAAIAAVRDGVINVKPAGPQRSASAALLSGANCLLVLEEGTGDLPAGSRVAIEPLESTLFPGT